LSDVTVGVSDATLVVVGVVVVVSVVVVSAVVVTGSVVVVASVEVVASVGVPVVSELVEEVSFEEVEVPVIAVIAENGSPSASAPDAITPSRSSATSAAATFATEFLLVRSFPSPAISTSPLFRP